MNSGLTEPSVTPELRTERLRLEPLREEHVDDMLSVLAPASLYEFTGGEPPSRDQLARRYEAQVAGSGDAEEIWHNWIMRLANTNEAIGYVQATVEPAATDIAWLVGARFQGQGYASEAAAGMAAWLRSDGETLTAHIRPDHERSEAVARRVGLHPSGTFDDDGEQIWTTETERRRRR